MLSAICWYSRVYNPALLLSNAQNMNRIDKDPGHMGTAIKGIAWTVGNANTM